MQLLERGNGLGQRVLVLNASYEPLQFISVRRAIVLLLQDKAELVEAAEQRLRARGISFEVPLVIRLVRYIRIPRRMRLPCSRRSILMRDRETCQYCGAQPGRAHLTVDHVIPRSRGGETTWENVVTACRDCNHRKGGRTPEEAGMTLLTIPRQPQYVAFALLGGARTSRCMAQIRIFLSRNEARALPVAESRCYVWHADRWRLPSGGGRPIPLGCLLCVPSLARVSLSGRY